MLDRKTKDVDASIELLEDRAKSSKIVFKIFFVISWSVVVISAFAFPYKYDEAGIGIGIALLIFATWFFIDMAYYTILIMIRRLDTKDEKNVG